jgi:hypothetical protein
MAYIQINVCEKPVGCSICAGTGHGQGHDSTHRPKSLPFRRLGLFSDQKSIFDAELD